MTMCIAHYAIWDERADFLKKATAIAHGMTVGTWTELSATRKSEMEKHLGVVLDIAPLDETEYAIPNARGARVSIGYPTINFSADIPALLVTVFGKLSLDGNIRLLDITLSDAFLKQCPGAKYGIHGIRDRTGVHGRPLLMSIFKSVVGYDLQELREQFAQQAYGGVDLIKDDEILFENPLTPLEKRVAACQTVCEDMMRHHGHTVLYAANLTGKTSLLATNARRAIAAGASALLFNVFAYGLDALCELASDRSITVPLVAHPACSGAIVSSTQTGISPALLLGKLLRIAGADLVLFPSPYGSVTMPRSQTVSIAHELTTPSVHRPVFPVPSAGIHPGLVPALLKDFGGDIVINAGGGIHGHPNGTTAGAQAFRQAIDATVAGIPLHDAPYEHLQAALARWGTRT
ncbi:MAG: 2,3-diketo-5-methylthiopentyl-1-phosphate enolase [Paenibacillaceae bacterium]|nr:2,3-diketo-5-methylthiopentyl-1-phosphate enolase [Paenibacillaceae bacterium]